MARWRLTAKHYIHVERNGEPTQWEWKETNRDTGRINRKKYLVPMYLDPDSPQDQNYPGDIIVAYRKGSQSKDLIVADDFAPTYDMEPLDDEAAVLSAKLQGKGDPFADLPTRGTESYGERLLVKLSEQLEKATLNSPIGPGPGEVKLKKLEEEIARLMDTNKKLQEQMKAKG